ncbi:hypothetical protein HII31_07867 [Pseudocercospora fuligena]|uniref:Uncharacterized protein n=1 Tax=Pseudocercospora fuligena TaxID=685502 RepID=A0A8H6VFS6_9PEZI|nr:hypothetical protein HII31_07867 [Pseudocercospora fuligena]
MAVTGEPTYHMLPGATESPSHSRKEEKDNAMVNVAPLGNGAVSSKVTAFTSGLATLEDWWFLEVLGISLSAGALIAIAIILSHFDNAPQPRWATVSLNTLVSWLSTLAKAMVLIPVSRGLAQLKWTWMAEKERALSDLQTFDNASRGLMGSLVLLFEQPGRHLAALAAIATLLALGFDPFIQNFIQYSPQSAVNATAPAFVSNASEYASVGIPMSASRSGGSWVYLVDPVMKANVYNSLINMDDSQAWSLPQYVCESGNCTWDPIATLAVRPSCKSFFHLLRRNCTTPFAGSSEETCDLGPPGMVPSLTYNKYASAMDIVMNLTTSNVSLVHENGPFKAVRMLMAEGSNMNATALAYGHSISNDSTIIATECNFEICVQSLQASVLAGNYVERSIAWYCNSTFLRRPEDWDALNPDSPTGWRWLEIRPPWGEEHGMRPNTTFGMTSRTLGSLQTFLSAIFAGYVYVSTPALMVISENPMYAAHDIAGSIFYGNLSGCVDQTDHLRCAAENTARAMTKTFRDSAVVARGRQDAVMATGRTLIMLSYVHIQWPWIILPVLVWLLAAVVWIGTSLKTRRAKIPSWREDILPLLFLYREEDKALGTEISSTSDNDFAALAGSTKVRLRVSDGRARLVET